MSILCFSPMHVGKDWIEHSYPGRKQKSPTGGSGGRYVSASHLRFMILALEGSIFTDRDTEAWGHLVQDPVIPRVLDSETAVVPPVPNPDLSGVSAPSLSL